MSIPAIPEQLHDEEASSEDSIYFTPEVSFAKSPYTTVNAIPATIKVTSLNSRDLHETPQTTPVRSATASCLLKSARKLAVDAANDKENTGYSTLAKGFVNVPLRRHPASTPLKSITNIATPVSTTPDVLVSVTPVKRSSKVDANASSVKLKNSKKNEPRSQRSFLQRLGIRQKITRKHDASKESVVPDVSVHDNDEALVIRIPKKTYGAICCERSTVESLETCRDDASNTSQLPVESLFDLSSVFVRDKITNTEPRKWTFPRLYPRKSMFDKFKVSPIKRLFTRSATCVYLFHEKYFKKLFQKKYQPLQSTLSCSESAVKEAVDPPFALVSNNVLEQLSLKLDSVTGVEQLMKQMVSKMESLENEVKELRSMLKENARGPVNCPPPPPPPPPPLPNFLTTAASKRKVDLTTPENDPLAKRPPRMVEQKAHFSITVEDLKNVKLRKTGNSKIIGGTTAEKSSVRDLSFHSATISKRKRRSYLSSKKDLSEIASQLLLSPRTKKSDQVENKTLFSPSSRTDTPVNPTFSIYDQTPVRTQRSCGISRSTKRKDWSGESPVRKRLNSGCSSPVCYDSHSDAAE